MKYVKPFWVLFIGWALVFLVVAYACQPSVLTPDENLVNHLQVLSDSSSLKKQDVEADENITSESLDAIGDPPLKKNDPNSSINPAPILGYAFVFIIIICFVLSFYFVVIKRVKNGIRDVSYHLKHSKEQLEEVLEQKAPNDLTTEEKEKMDDLLAQLKKVHRKF